MDIKRSICYGIVGNLLAAILLSILSLTTKLTFLNKLIPLWLLIITALLSISAFLSLVYQIISKPKQVFLLISQFSDNQFVASLIQNIIHKLEYQNIQVVVMIPSENLSPLDQQRWFNKISKYKNHFIGGIIIPLNYRKNTEEFIDFITKFNKPILLIDASPSFSSNEYPEKCAFIGFDNEEGGRLAAEAMFHEFDKMGKNDPNILIIASKEVPERQRVFESHLKRLMKDARITCNEDGSFRRDDGYRIYKQMLYVKNKYYKSYQGVFCTNDEMALGVLDAMNEIPELPNDKIILIGYDAIVESTKLIMSGNTPFKNTVKQDPIKLANEGVVRLLNMINNKKFTKFELLSPILHISVNNN